MSFKAVINFLIYSNIWISLGAVCFTAFYFESFQLPFDWNFFLFIFFATLFTYNFQRIVKLRFKNHSLSGPRLTWLQTNRRLIISITILSFIASLFFGVRYVWETWVIISAISVFSFFYIWKIPFSDYNLRSIPMLKIYLVSLTWILTTVLLPDILFREGQMDSRFLIFTAATFLFILSITIPFDIRDIYKDEAAKKTIPQLIGVNSSKLLSMFLFLVSHIGYCLVFNEIRPGVLLNLVLGTILIYKTEVDRKDQYYTGLIDGLLITPLAFFNI